MFALPTGVLLAGSFLAYDGARVTASITADNYTALLGDGYFRLVLWRTLWMSGAVGAVCVMLGLLVAHYLVRSHSRFRGLVLLIVISPLVSSVVVRTYGWLVLLEREGLVNSTLEQLGAIDQPMKLIGSQFAIVIGLAHVLLPFAVFTVMSSLQGVDPSLERASRDLGAGPVTTFRKVTLPLISPGLISGFILTFAISLGAYATPRILGGGQLQTLATLVQERMISSLEWGQAAGIAVIILAIGGTVVAFLLLIGRRAQAQGAAQ
ncbi:ABC transporter permease [Nocardioides sp. NPDC087217]|uniref:ABC transporter permease n=1 Tax=Nocardioides sp. NPDC087217 TaxID=3364335 RepID=UPI0038223492